jgi:hypothetical protein
VTSHPAIKATKMAIAIQRVGPDAIAAIQNAMAAVAKQITLRNK